MWSNYFLLGTPTRIFHRWRTQRCFCVCSEWWEKHWNVRKLIEHNEENCSEAMKTKIRRIVWEAKKCKSEWEEVAVGGGTDAGRYAGFEAKNIENCLWQTVTNTRVELWIHVSKKKKRTERKKGDFFWSSVTKKWNRQQQQLHIHATWLLALRNFLCYACMYKSITWHRNEYFQG